MHACKAMGGMVLALVMILGPAAWAAAAGGVMPCSLLTKAEAAQAMGRSARAVVTQTHTNPLGQRRCFWDVPDDNQMRYVLVQITCDSSLPPNLQRSGYSSAKLYADSKRLLDRPRDISGLGRAAFWGGGGLRLGAGLHVFTGKCYFTVGVGTGDPKTSLARAKEVAAKVISRLP